MTRRDGANSSRCRSKSTCTTKSRGNEMQPSERRAAHLQSVKFVAARARARGCDKVAVAEERKVVDQLGALCTRTRVGDTGATHTKCNSQQQQTAAARSKRLTCSSSAPRTGAASVCTDAENTSYGTRAHTTARTLRAEPRTRGAHAVASDEETDLPTITVAIRASCRFRGDRLARL